MKHLKLITHTDFQQDLSDHLRKLEQVSGYTFSHAEGHGIEEESDPFLSARDKVVGHAPRIRLDIFWQDKNVVTVLNTLRSSINGMEGEGINWVTDVEKNGRL